MRLNDDCGGVMHNDCFHYELCKLLIVNVVMTNTEYPEDL